MFLPFGGVDPTSWSVDNGEDISDRSEEDMLQGTQGAWPGWKVVQNEVHTKVNCL